MTAVLVAGIFTVGAVCIVEGYLLFGRMQILANFIEQVAAAQGVRLADKPSKSAPRTEAPEDAPRVHWDETPEAAAWAAARPEDLPTEPQPIVQPDTVPSHEALTVQAVYDTGPRDEDLGRVADVELAHVLADMDNFVIDMERRDAERKARAA